MKRVILSWSSGKDSAWALYKMQQSEDIEIIGLLTTVNSKFNRVAMHGVREDLLDAQAEAADLRLFKIPLPWPCSNADYEKALRAAFIQFKDEYEITHIAYGDLFLEDVRQYRVDLMKGSGIQPLFPIYGLPTKELAAEMVSSGLSAYLACIDPKQLDKDMAGSVFNDDFLSKINTTVDPCGENGEFHTFTYSGPMFNSEINVRVGESLCRDGFIFTDLILVN